MSEGMAWRISSTCRSASRRPTCRSVNPFRPSRRFRSECRLSPWPEIERQGMGHDPRGHAEPRLVHRRDDGLGRRREEIAPLVVPPRVSMDRGRQGGRPAPRELPDRAVTRADQRDTGEPGGGQGLQAGPEGPMRVDQVRRPGAAVSRRPPGRDHDALDGPRPEWERRETDDVQSAAEDCRRGLWIVGPLVSRDGDEEGVTATGEGPGPGQERRGDSVPTAVEPMREYGDPHRGTTSAMGRLSVRRAGIDPLSCGYEVSDRIGALAALRVPLRPASAVATEPRARQRRG